MKLNRFLMEGDKVLFDERQTALTIVEVDEEELRLEGPEQKGDVEVFVAEDADTDFRARHQLQQKDGWSNKYRIWNFRRVS